MPKVDELLRLHTSVSLSPASSASSLPSVYSPGSIDAPHKNKTQAGRTKKRDVKPKIRQINGEVKGDRNSLDGGLTGEDSSVWPVLVAVRCRPRKRQRAKGRFTAGIGADEEIRRSDSQDSSDSSASSSGRGTNYSGTVQRGVFEYAACREYDFSANYDGKVPPPQIRRPRRLYVQGLRSGSTSGRRSFDFDFIFPPWKRQRDVYDSCVEAQIRHVLQSHQQGQVQHATIVAYGQTGTGKTFTMGMLSDFNDEEAQGLIPRALSQVLEGAGNREEAVVTLSFLQIYLETIQDLLSISGSNALATRGKSWSKHNARRTNSDLSVRQGRDGAFYVTDLNEYEISSIQDAHALLELAVRNRVLAATTKNKTSSRSHTLLTISIKHRRRSRYSSSEDESDHDEPDSDEEELKQASTISFVDLAGSERVDGALHFLRATRARQEQRIREAKFINRSLSALGDVIAALAQPKPGGSASTSNVLGKLTPCLQDSRPNSVGNEQGQPHIRFRDSQLTKLLQGRLMSGRGRLLLIATVDDQPKNLSETLSTLKFAAQCRRVELQRGAKGRGDRNHLRRQKSLLDQVFNDMKMMHENREAALHSEYQARIGALERELETARAAVQTPTPEDVASVHVASYTALCSLVDTVCNDSSNHPNVVDFESGKNMLDYVAGLYSRLKEALVVQRHPLSSRDAAHAVTIANTRLDPKATSTREKERKSLGPCTLIQTPTLSTNNASSCCHVPLSSEQEAEFRAVARHLIATHALDSYVVSSSDEDE
ncbi:hypothetical protein V7S43_003502 [Phytophthora oleae]|uniref:Kinesin-like protein n=1 Tax=Phytophthora oleae TaxID=2107226 RepID=A0ABD3FYU4_9STRA